MTLWNDARLLIDGELVEATGGRRFENLNPATEEVIGQVPNASAEDAERAIAAARRTFDTTDWSRNHEFRSHCLRQLRDGLQARLEELREVTVAEVGCPISMTYGAALDDPVSWLGHYADFLDAYEWRTDMGVAEVMGGRHQRWVEREPMGVVGAITPWNVPNDINLKKLGWALAAGCTVVLKAAPTTSWCANFLGEVIANDTDIPPGAVNVLTASETGVGEIITNDPRVDLIGFTGSTATGKRILEVCAPQVKPAQLELGGKSAALLLPDTPGLAAVAGAMGAVVCFHAGQGCAILTRLLVPKNELDAVVDATTQALRDVKYGDPMDPENIMGPLNSAIQRERVEGHIQRAIADGAKLVVGGGRPKHLTRGYFIEPTAFVADENAALAQDEVFGPVQCIIGYEDEADAIRIANNSRYGLSGAVMGPDVDHAIEVARQIRTGTVSVCGGAYYNWDVPFGGYKHSGIGREHSVIGFEEHLEAKTIAVPAG
ncbi:MAG: aldehyde dehydrogenase family protein [Deltaproteobacteria bacterium]|jgi:aldehyde dehydrogenase (NAD+)|nr:aldehyde dehydrogenase family protein [Deltaproteobacteria bacterium]MBW2500892.1 aldehyde dehydrogenase family protein [Deltaproteobacteria bacterium]